ncbi:unnamed protein product [Arctogadus glacialis]
MGGVPNAGRSVSTLSRVRGPSGGLRSMKLGANRCRLLAGRYGAPRKPFLATGVTPGPALTSTLGCSP